MDAAGGGRHALTTAGSTASLWFDAEPSFSPDGETLVFSHSTGDTSDLVELPAAGGARHPLSIAGSGPAWGPARLAFVDARQGVETVLPDGSQPSVVVASDPGLVGGSLAWSRGGRLAWLDAHAGGRLSLAVWSGSGVVRKPLGPLRRAFRGSGLAWSPDGTRLAFTACEASDVCDLWTAAADGTGLRRLTHGLGAIGRLSWTG
jgi:Tol biopolymer transport system component